MGTRLLLPKRGNNPQFSAHVYCGQTAVWIRMPFGMVVGLGSGHIVLDGEQAPPKRGHCPNFRPLSNVAEQLDGSRWHLTWRKASARPHCARSGPSSPKRGHSPPIFDICLLWPKGWMDQYSPWYGGRPETRRHFVRWEPSSPMKRGTTPATFRPLSIVAKRTHISANC